MLFNLFGKSLAISYGITVCNEVIELKNLLTILIPLIDRNDEIIVLQDITHKSLLVSKLLAEYKGKLVVVEALLNNNFAAFKNKFLTTAKGDYLFQIDADEIPKAFLIKNLKKIILTVGDCDCFLVPRINIVNGYTDDQIQKWNWNVNDKNYINFPDHQPRIIKLKGAIKWRYKVHEELVGYHSIYKLPADIEDFCLIHIKDIEKQERQNEFYKGINIKSP